MIFIKRNVVFLLGIITAGFMMHACNNMNRSSDDENSKKIHLITLDPAHFHAALVQKSMYPDIDSVVKVYAPKGLGLTEQLNYIKQYNSRKTDPTHWVEKVYTGDDYLQRMLSDQGAKSDVNIVVTAGNNKRKTEYIKKSVDAGLNVLADKPMAISTEDFDTLKQAFVDAGERGVVLYDIMTERSVMATILQRMLMHTTTVFGALKQGTPDSPAVFMESVHRYYKHVSGKPLIRPSWFFDPTQEGDAIVDVGTHLVDLVQWVCFPEQSIDYKKDISINSARIWPTPLTLSQFSNITGKERFPDFLKQYLADDSLLLTHGNGEIKYTIKNIHTDIITKWTYQAPEGGGDTYHSLLRGTKADLEIRQGKEESWKPVLYVWPAEEVTDKRAYEDGLKKVIGKINEQYAGVRLEAYKEGWKVIIPQKYLLGHEAHFADVMERYLKYLEEGQLPDWEVKGMIAKYYTTTKALSIARQK